MNLKQHKELASKLHTLRNYLLEEINKYPNKTKAIRSEEQKALIHLERLRDNLDDILFKNFSEKKTHILTKIYYGWE
jgi:hypothetical protein